MENIRCVIADIPQIMLADIIHQVAVKKPGIDVVCRIEDIKDLPRIVEELNIDVVILGGEAESIYQALNDLLEVLPQTVAVGVVNDGRRVCICVDDIGPTELFNLIESAMQNRGEGGKI